MSGPQREGTDEAHWVRLAEQAAGSGHFLMLSHGGRFLNPLVRSERRRLRDCEDFVDPGVLALARDELAPRFQRRELARGVYFPVPLRRALAGGAAFEDAVHRFFYDLIVIDVEQRWWWRGSQVAARTRDFLIEHLRWEEEIGRWLFEYKVHDGWFDKSYLEAQMTPLRAVRIEETVPDDSEDAAILLLQTGRRVAADLDSFHLDEEERLFVDGEGVGEVLVGDGERFRLLKTADERLGSILVAGDRRRLRWPNGARSAASRG